MNIQTPLTKEKLSALKPNQVIYLSGTIYTARDAAHKRLVDMISKGEKLPISPENAIIYYTGPCPAKDDDVIGSCGPTTSARMDVYTPTLLDNGVIATIGKGTRNEQVVKSLQKNKAAYFIAIGGAGAFYKQCVKRAEVVAFDDLGSEAIFKLEIENMPLIVG